MISTIISSFGISDIFSLLIIFLVIYVTKFYYNHFTRPNPLPGPFPFPIVGNLPQCIGLKTNDWMTLMHKKYGDLFELNFGSQRLIIVGRPDLLENMNVSSTKTKYPIRFIAKEGTTEYGITGLGLFHNNDITSWKYSRKFFTQAVMKPSFSYQAIEWTIELCEQMEYCWNKLGDERELDLTIWMHRFTNDMIFRVSTGIKYNSISSYYHTLNSENNDLLNEKEKEEIEESERFIQSMETFMNGVMYFAIFGKFIRRYAPFIRSKINSLLKNRDYLFNTIYDVIKKRRIEIENTPLDQPLRHDMLTSYIIANTPRDVNVADAEYSRPMTDKEILGNLMDAMIAGTGTTTSLICFIIYYIEHYPEVKQQLRQELETVLGKDVTKPITFKDLDELQYCDAIIKEVHRHCPVVFFMGRVNVETDEIGGYNWPKGTTFHMLYSAVLKHKNYWTDPEKFDPNRFYKIEESEKYLLEKQHIKNSFIMWGGGIRICPGRKLAMIEMKCLLASIYRKYDIELVDKNAPLNYKSTSLNICKELLVKIKPRKF